VIQLDHDLEHGKTNKMEFPGNAKMTSSIEKTDDKTSAHPWLGARATSLALGIAIVFAVVLGIYFGMDAKNTSVKESESSNASNNQGTAVALTSLYEHNTSNDCWLLIHGNVYDLTEFVHPGGSQWITNSCGKDATQSFSAHHSQGKLKSVSERMVGSLSTAQEQQQSTAQEQQQSTGSSQNSDTSPKGDYEEDSGNSPKGDYEKNSGNSPQGDYKDNDDDAESSSDEVTERESSGDTLEYPAADTPVTCTQQFYSSNDVETHSSEDSCWLVLYDTVFDFTNFLNRHPGGSRVISQRCGTDATQAFSAERKHDEWLLKTEASAYLIGKLGSETGSFGAPCQ